MGTRHLQQGNTTGSRTGSELAEIFATRADLVGLIRFTSGCIEGYRDTFEPGTSRSRAETNLFDRLHREGLFSVLCPDWLHSNAEAIGYVLLAGDIAVRLRPDVTERRAFIADSLTYRSSK